MIANLILSFFILCTLAMCLHIIRLCLDIKDRFDADPLRRFDRPPNPN